MDRIPATLHAPSAPSDNTGVARWWAGLSDKQCGECVGLWDPRHDFCTHALTAEDDGQPAWRKLPLVVGRFTDPDDSSDGDDWRPDHFEHLLSHPEIWPLEADPWQVGGVCTRHEAARAALRAGHILAGFVCPLAATDCPMRRLLALLPGRDVRLRMISNAPLPKS